MAYLCFTRLPGREEQRTLPRPLHECTTIAEIKGAFALTLSKKEADMMAGDIELELEATIFGGRGPVSVARDEEWLYIRAKLETTTQPVTLSFRNLPSTSAPDSRPESEAGRQDKITALEQHLIEIQLHSKAVKKQVDAMLQEGQMLAYELFASQRGNQKLEQDLREISQQPHDRSIEKIQEVIRSETNKILSKAANAQRLERDEFKQIKDAVAQLVQSGNSIDEINLTQAVANTEELSSETYSIAQRLLEKTASIHSNNTQNNSAIVPA